MTPHNSQTSLFDHGDAEAVTERSTSDATCVFCAVLRGEEKVTLKHNGLSGRLKRALKRMGR
ncbi:MAG: hypothetical protein ACRDRX_08830 [Pseudonocardiaceae bacterium]